MALIWSSTSNCSVSSANISRLRAKSGLHFVDGVRHPQPVEEQPHADQAEQHADDAIAGDGERSLDRELLQIESGKTPARAARRDRRASRTRSAIQAEIAVTTANSTVKPKIESRYGSTNTCAPMPKIKPPMKAPASRRTCFCRDEPMVESAVMKQVDDRGAESRPRDRRVSDVAGHGRERAAQGELCVGGIGEGIANEQARGLLFVQRRE